MKLQRSEIDTLIFDMDGVITNEQIYWDTAALTVYELLYSREYYGRQELDREWCYKNVRRIFQRIFCDGKVIRTVKRLGVNTNWDLAYLVFGVSRYLEPELETFEEWHFTSVSMFLENVALQPPELYVAMEGLIASAIPGEVGCYKRGEGRLWQELTECFARWFHGTAEVPGLKENEEPILPMGELRETLSALRKEGFRLGIGTGRPREEILYPLQKWGLEKYFVPEYIATYDEVLEAEKELSPSEPLAKPHPFVFQKAAFGTQYTNRQLYEGAVPQDLAKRCLVVGDAPSDLFAAKAGGFPFAAVLTGVEGETARTYFKENQAELILDSALDLKTEG